MEDNTITTTSEESSVTDVVENNDLSISVENTEMEGSLSVTVDEPKEEVQETVETLEMPEKFANAEDPMQALLKSYNELQKKISKPDEKVEEKSEETTVEDSQPDEQPSEPASVVSTAQDMWAKQGGQLTDEQWTDLASKTGVPMDTLRAWEAYVKADLNTAMQSNDEKIYELSGGQDQYNKMIDWANSSLSDDQINSLNAQLDNPQFSDTGVAALKGLYNQAHGFEPKVSLQGSASTDSTSLAPGEFLNEADFQKAMEHPDYGKGGRYDKEFDAKTLRYMKRTGQI